MNTDKSSRILRIKDVLDRTGLSRSMLYEMINKGTFPKPIKLGIRAVGWKEDAVEAWVATREQKRQV